jgi:PAS domain S-box-containing protein
MATDKKEHRILIIEDNPGDFALVEDFLFEQIESPVIIHAKNFKEAKDSLTTDLHKFDVVLLDLSLPDNTGEQLILEMVELCRHIPVIVLTGYTDFSFGVKSLSLGVSDYLLKDDLTSMSLYKSIIYSAERKKSFAELEESEKRYSEVFHFSPLPMWVINLDTYAFLDVNKATIEHYGYTREEFLSMTLKELRPAEDVAGFIKDIEEDKGQPGLVARRITVHKKKNGELIKVEVQFAQFIYKGVKSNIVIATDITERLNYIKAIEDQNEKLREISWIQSHVVRSPLSRIMGLIPLIKDADDSAEKEMMMDYVVASANELDEIIRNITAKSTGDNDTAEPL